MKSVFKNSIPHFAAIIIFILASYIYFFPVLQGQGVKQHDIEQFKGSAQEIIEHREAHGEEPLWTNSMFGGMPAYLISTNFGGNLLTFVDNVLQFGKRPASYMFFTLVGFYILLLVLKVNPWLSIVGAFAYALSAYFFIVIAAGHNAKMHAITYVAPMLAGMFLAFRGKYLGGFVLFALFLGLNLNAGHVQITYYAGFVMLAIGIAFLIDTIRDKSYAQFSKAVGVLLLAAILAVGANFSRLYFTWESGKHSIRGASELTDRKDDRTSGLDKEYATAWSYGVAETFNLLIPNLMGGSSSADFGIDSQAYKFLIENRVPPAQARDIVKQLPAYWGPQPMTSGPVYLGAVVVFLFVLGLFLLRGTTKWALFGVTLLAIMLAWGSNFMPLTDFFLNYFPAYNKFRTVSMILYIAEITVPLIGILALKEIFQGNVNKEKFMHGFKWAVGITGGICLFFALFGSSFFHFEAEVDQRYIQSGYPAEMFDALRLDRQSMLRADAFRSLVFILLGAAALLGYQLKKLKLQHAIAIIGVLIIADMWTVNRRYLNNDNFVPNSKVERPFVASHADKQILADTTTYYRVYNTTVSTFNDASTSYFHKSIGGYHGAKLRRYQEIIDNHIQPGRENWDVLNMLNTRYTIRRTEQGQAARYNPRALGNAWFVDSVKMVNNADEEIAALRNFDPAKVAIVDKRFEEIVKNYKPSPAPTDTIYLTDYRANRLVYKYKLKEDRLAVFSDIYYPVGWHSKINNEEQEHFRVNYILRSMILPAGNNKVVFEYKPKMYKAGYGVDLVSSLLIILSTLFWIGYEAYKYNFKENNSQKLL
ncbi:MAG: hypothetical protein ACLFNU_07315 [Bacteroidales bacterium]